MPLLLCWLHDDHRIVISPSCHILNTPGEKKKTTYLYLLFVQYIVIKSSHPSSAHIHAHVNTVQLSMGPQARPLSVL